jgi:hypothetical protein
MGSGSLAREKGIRGGDDFQWWRTAMELWQLCSAREMDELRFFQRRGTQEGGGGSEEYRPPVLLSGRPDRRLACAARVARPRPGAWCAAPRERPHGRVAPCAWSGGDPTGGDTVHHDVDDAFVHRTGEQSTRGRQNRCTLARLACV